jgi:hypothetical protein
MSSILGFGRVDISGTGQALCYEPQGFNALLVVVLVLYLYRQQVLKNNRYAGGLKSRTIATDMTYNLHGWTTPSFIGVEYYYHS